MDTQENHASGNTSRSIQKAALRKQILSVRNALTDRSERSVAIHEKLTGLREWQNAQQRLYFVSARSEVDTWPLLTTAIDTVDPVIVPWCRDDQHLGLCKIRSLDELTDGRFGISEPRPEIRHLPVRVIDPALLDVVLVPGAVFDLAGNRLGYGKGYYDRLLTLLSDRCKTVALAFECQIVEAVPHDKHDVPVDVIVTEERVIDCQPSSA